MRPALYFLKWILDGMKYLNNILIWNTIVNNH